MHMGVLGEILRLQGSLSLWRALSIYYLGLSKETAENFAGPVAHAGREVSLESQQRCCDEN